ncbi:acetylglutamate kinase [Alteromonas ponticola]|uniref:Acetylglutamate kinase n=1 Tax=Alteromonas ponticola TaxID=2720613 RepID=A0ABX1R3J4_9ALTE|nr:acetylglutamate kinase [Alteromonas ponticola]NMH60072.1 acetylglutamate kinase [Alteromonas ponticola]
MKRVVIKVGGALLDQPSTITSLFAQIKQLQSQAQIVLVHGGGTLTEKLLTQLGLTSEKKNGLRVTPVEHMPIIAGTLAGTANKVLCAQAHTAGLAPVGLSLIDGNIISCTQLDADYGAVGVPQANQSSLFEVLMTNRFLPVVSSIGCDHAGQLLNVNADHAATAIAKLLNAQLIMLSDVAGVLGHDDVLIKQLDANHSQELQQKGVIGGGMQVKVDAAFQAANTLAQPVAIASWNDRLSDILAAHCGTQIISSSRLEHA